MFSLDEVMADQVSYCGYFLTIKEGKEREVGLIHQSAKDYLLRQTPDSNPKLEDFRVKEEVGNLEIARKCLDCLQKGALDAGKFDLRRDTAYLKAFPLLSYAALHWPEHARILARSEDIFDLSRPFYQKKSRESWLKTYWAAKGYGNPPDSFTLLHLASYFGIVPLAQNLLLKEGWINKLKDLLYLNKRDSHGGTALHRAAGSGHEAVVRLLLEKGADVKARDSYGRTALHWAASSGHEAVVRLLLEKGADVKARDSDGGTALHRAASRGQEAVVRLLLEKGADVKARDSDRGTALHWAASSGQEAVVRLLLEKRADVKATDSDGGTALHRAARSRQEAVVRLLLEKGADVKATDSDGGTALHRAARSGHEAVVRLLLEKGADVKAKDSQGGTALHWAAGNEAVVRLLTLLT
jgi:ankyrin repeat protein